jgi:hypothetical protein
LTGTKWLKISYNNWFFENGDEILDSIEKLIFHELSDYQLFKEDILIWS